jgi:hypothetical protein
MGMTLRDSLIRQTLIPPNTNTAPAGRFAERVLREVMGEVLARVQAVFED